MKEPITAADIINEARSWVGTPWRHQSRVKGLAVDCVGLLIGVGEALGLETKDIQGYGRQPTGELPAMLERHMVKVREPQPGDVVLMRFDIDPQHVGILTDVGTIIHVYESGIGKCVEHRYSNQWRARTVAIYRNRDFAQQQEAAHA